MLNESVQEENTLKLIKFPALFYMELEELIHAKSNALMDLRKLEVELLNIKHDLTFEENEILLKTDFKELGLTNEKMRKAYISDQLYDEKCNVDFKKAEIETKKDTIEIINHLINIKEFELKGD